MAEKYITFVAYYFYKGINPKKYVLIIGININTSIVYGALEFRLENKKVFLDSITSMKNDLKFFEKKYNIFKIPNYFSYFYSNFDDDFLRIV